jgi:hypothetical protein
MNLLAEGFAFSDVFGEIPELRSWVLEHDDAGRFLPGFPFAWGFYPGHLTHRSCYTACFCYSLLQK